MVNAPNYNTLFISGFQFNDDYHRTRQVALDLGVGDNDWIYEDEEDWEEAEDEGLDLVATT